ncbi:hypothetical protein VRRI112168_00475 [Vreelandella rituensis]|uniref:Uncharacterized protein n=1 Tax=Vreelandella rituensis TaxID=2282306 RepID=A0A368U9D2_9GAMM|nr:hypothetical protein [Halomonas rituensis]RCV93828.1 hypothetical protein DU506_01335 [Halomonas rituensis]
MASRDIPSFNEIVAASSSFSPIKGYYPGSGPDGAGETDAPDGPFINLPFMVFDPYRLPAYLLRAAVENEQPVQGPAANDPEALERALMEELGIDPDSLASADADVSQDSPTSVAPSAATEAATAPGTPSNDTPPKRSNNTPS